MLSIATSLDAAGSRTRGSAVPARELSKLPTQWCSKRRKDAGRLGDFLEAGGRRKAEKGRKINHPTQKASSCRQSLSRSPTPTHPWRRASTCAHVPRWRGGVLQLLPHCAGPGRAEQSRPASPRPVKCRAAALSPAQPRTYLSQQRGGERLRGRYG